MKSGDVGMERRSQLPIPGYGTSKLCVLVSLSTRGSLKVWGTGGPAVRRTQNGFQPEPISISVPFVGI